MKHYTDGTYWNQRKGFRSDYKVPLLTKTMEQAGVAIRDNTRIVEVGCGNGAFLWPFSESLAQRNVFPELHGIDIAENAIVEARASSGLNPPTFSCTTIEQHSAEYDIALLVDVLEHVPCPFEFLTHAGRLAPVLFIHLPIEHSFLHLLTHRPTASYRAYRHLHFFSIESATLLLEAAGWRIVTLRHSAADSATLRLPASRLLMWSRYLRYLAYKAAPGFTAIACGGSVTFACARKTT
jgi:hypothetical protein